MSQPPPLDYRTPSTPPPPAMRFGRGLMGWVIFIGVAVMLFVLLQGNRPSSNDISLSEFQQRLQSDQIAELRIEGDRIRGTFHQPYVIKNVQVKMFSTNLPAGSAPMMTPWILEHRAHAEVYVDDNQNLLMTLLVPLIPWLLIFGFIWFFVFRQLRRGNPAPGTFASLMLALLVLSGCGYRNGQAAGGKDDGYHWQSLYRDDVRTVAVPIFTTTSFDRGAEFGLTTAVVKQIEANTPYKVVPATRADTVLEGQVVEVRASTLSTNRNTGLPQEQLMGLTVDFIWKDLRTGRVLVERRNFDQTAPFYPTLGEGRFAGRQQAVERLALAIVQELQADW